MNSELYKAYIDLAGPEAVQKDEGFIALVDAQTGLGKTYQATELQIEHLISDSKKKLIYATNLRVNVKEAYEDLINRINSSSKISSKQKKLVLKTSSIYLLKKRQ